MPAKYKTRKIVCAYQGVRNVRFSENLTCFVFLKHPFLDFPFCLITDEILVILYQFEYKVFAGLV